MFYVNTQISKAEELIFLNFVYSIIYVLQTRKVISELIWIE